MMIVDHIASTIILSNSIRTVRKERILWVVCILSAIIPDLLASFYHPGSIEYLFHRRYTNSIFLAPIYVLVISALFKLIFFRTQLPFYVYFLVSLSNYYLHILLDLITPFGSTIFYPLSNKVYSLDIFHSFDPIFMVISSFVIIISVFYIFKKRKSFFRFFRLSLYAYIVYFLFMLIFKFAASSNFEKYLSHQYPSAQYEAIVPRTFWRWRAIATDQYHILQLNGILNVQKVNKYSNINDTPEFIKRDKYFEDFLLYARYPAIEATDDQISVINTIYSDQSYRLTFEIENDSIISKKISGFDLFDK